MSYVKHRTIGVQLRAGPLLLLAGLITACGGGGADAPASTDPPPASNNAPSIGGSPALAVTVGQPYSFTPVASDPDGDVLTFSISAQPEWSSFDPSTGRLTGTPDASHVGINRGVSISVSDGNMSVTLAPFDLAVEQLQLGSATVSWDAPLTNADGSLLSDLASYRVYYGNAPANYTAMIPVSDATANSAVISNLLPGTWFFAVTALDQSGNESEFSAEVSKVINP